MRAERKIPFLGICFGMQLACVEFARNVCGLTDARHQRGQRNDHQRGDRLTCPISAISISRAARCVWAPTIARSNPTRSRRKAYGELQHQRTPSPPLRIQQPLQERSSKSTGCGSPAIIRRADDAGRDDRIAARACTRGSSARKRIRSSNRGRTRPSPLYRDFIAAALHTPRSRSENAGTGALVTR